uniref:Uncharacterized protein n=1 Tax=Plectus sambesii TaxID=2011161 RepID=A0A914UKA6_9BILA
MDVFDLNVAVDSKSVD